MPPPFVIDALAVTAEGKGRDDLLWPSATGGYLGPPASKQSWLASAVARCQQTDPTSRGSPPTVCGTPRRRWQSVPVPTRRWSSGCWASAAMTLDVYADVFDSDLDLVADNVAELWPDVVRLQSDVVTETPGTA